jgi:bacillithiol system protein YtxJ
MLNSPLIIRNFTTPDNSCREFFISTMNWIELQSIEQAKELINSSSEKPVLFFKHSTRCSISNMAKDRLERKWDIDDSKVAPIYLDLLNHRDVSNFLAEDIRYRTPISTNNFSKK